MQDAIKLTSNDLYTVGDTHSISVFKDIVEKVIPENSNVLHIGDCGIGFSRKDLYRLERLSDACKLKNVKAYIIRGNHDDPDYWNRDLKLENVTLVKDYTRLIFPNEKEALCIGGGISVDRMDRVENVSYWINEGTPYWPQYCNKCDYIFMHDAPSYFNLPTASLKQNFKYYCENDKTILKHADFQRTVIDRIVALCQPEKIIGGHFHNSKFEKVGNIEYRSLNINEVYMFLA